MIWLYILNVILPTGNCLCVCVCVWGGGGGGVLFSHQSIFHPSVCPSITFWFLLLILLNNFKNLFIFCKNVDVDKMFLLQKNNCQGVNSFRFFSFVILEKSFGFILFCSILLVSASYFAK